MNRIIEAEGKKFIIDSFEENSIGKYLRLDYYPDRNAEAWFIVYVNKDKNYRPILSLLYEAIENKYPELLL